MPESIAHQKLKQEAVQLLISKGYKREKILIDKKRIIIEYYGHKYTFTIDVYATNDTDSAVECGNFPKWKRPIYEKYFGKEHLIHFPYPPTFGKYLITDIEEDNLSHKQAKQFLINTYNKQIYAAFKDDPIFDFQEFTEQSREIFDIDNHRTYREINPDYSNKPEAKGKTIWMNFPDSATISKDEYKHKIHWGMLYYSKNKVGITFIFSGKDACEDFLGLSNETHQKVHEALNNLPPKYFIRDGNSFWDKSSRPPLDKEWNNPISCIELSWEQYSEILDNLDNVIRLQKNGFKIGPVLDLAKVFCEDEEVPEHIGEFRELYSLLLKSETKVDVIAGNIKKIESWEWYISQRNEWEDLFGDYVDKFGEIKEEDFNKACRKLRYDPNFKEWMKK